MRIVFMGTPDFAASVLSELASQHEVVAVYTRPDAVRGRGKQLVRGPGNCFYMNVSVEMVPGTEEQQCLTHFFHGIGRIF